MINRGSSVHKPMVNFSRASPKLLFFFLQISQIIDDFRQFTSLLKFIKLNLQTKPIIDFFLLHFTKGILWLWYTFYPSLPYTLTELNKNDRNQTENALSFKNICLFLFSGNENKDLAFLAVPLKLASLSYLPIIIPEQCPIGLPIPLSELILLFLKYRTYRPHPKQEQKNFIK